MGFNMYVFISWSPGFLKESWATRKILTYIKCQTSFLRVHLCAVQLFLHCGCSILPTLQNLFVFFKRIRLPLALFLIYFVSTFLRLTREYVAIKSHFYFLLLFFPSSILLRLQTSNTFLDILLLSAFLILHYQQSAIYLANMVW